MNEANQSQKIDEQNDSNNKIIDVNHKEDEKETKEPLPISRKMRWIVFIFFIMITVFMGLDQGILSSTTSDLMKDFKMNERELGGFGGMVFFGNAIGCLCSFALINKFNRKCLLMTSMSLDVLSLFLTTQTKNILLLYTCRTIAGLTQSFLAIYAPVWSDQFGAHKSKSIMLALIHIFSSIGYLFGYIMGILMGWENSFFIQNFILIIHILVIFIFLPDKYFSMSLMPLKAKLHLQNLNKDKKDKEEKEDKEANVENEEINKIKKMINEVVDNEEHKKNLIDDKDKEKKAEEDNDIESLFEDIQTKNEDLGKESFIVYLKVLINSPIYILMNITLTSIFMIVSGVQFWINDYLENGLLIKDEKTRLYCVISVVVTSLPLGIILGGIISGKIGGYDTEKAIYIPLIASFIVSIFANLAPLTDKLVTFFVLFWIYLFMGSILLPVARGIVLVSIDKKYNGPGNAVSTLIYSIFGKLPGPNLYAFYKSKFTDKHSRIPFWLLLNMAIPGFLATLICVKFQREKYRKLRNEDNNKGGRELDSFNEEKKHENKKIENSNNIIDESTNDNKDENIDDIIHGK